MTEAFDYDKLPSEPDGRKHCKTRARVIDECARIADRRAADCKYCADQYRGGTDFEQRWRARQACHEGTARDIRALASAPGAKRWVNLYERSCFHHETREGADRAAGPDRVACVEVEL